MLALSLAAALALSAFSAAQDIPAHTNWPGPGQLFVGTCYQPIDRSPEQIDRDIAIMKRAGFNVVRMGDLSWDSFEPAQGKFEFEWFDKIMDKMQANGIRVILDIPGLPAPIWLHRAHPGVDIVNQNGTRLPPAERYMDNISDPDYVREVGILADALTKRYAHHPAVIAVGYDNEIGNGFMSYSEADRQRFIAWLKKKYGTIEESEQSMGHTALVTPAEQFRGRRPAARRTGPDRPNATWICIAIGPMSRWRGCEELDAIRRRNMPISHRSPISGIPQRGADSIIWPRTSLMFHTALKVFIQATQSAARLGALMTKGDLGTPIWFNEFTAGGGGFYGTPGRSRMYAFLSLCMMGAQGSPGMDVQQSSRRRRSRRCSGLVDHDGTPSWKVNEFARIASEFKQLSKFGFPRYTHPQVAIAYSFDSFVDSTRTVPPARRGNTSKPSYTDQVQGAFEPFFRGNIDTAIINIGHRQPFAVQNCYRVRPTT